jgi:quinoprotein glucose dehydrogenase
MTDRAGASQRQYLVISAGGHGPLGTPRGDYLIAFALPAMSAAARP